jgi:hypothetical protein
MNEVKRCLGMPIRRRQHLRASAAMVVAILTTALLGLASSSAKANDSCNCQANVTRTVTFCIDGTNYTANVDFCEVNYTAPLPAGDCNSAPQDRKSTLRKICFVGAQPIGYTDAEVIGYILCHVQSTACNLPPPNPYGFFVPNNGVFCWEIKVPKCTMRDNGCIVPCGDCKYCIHAFQWDRVGGTCSLTGYWKCNGSDCDGQNCTENEGCPLLNCCP